MRAAADLEDSSEKHVAMENRFYPMRELLGDLLMEQGQADEALKTYEASMKNARERLRGFYGAAKAAEASGDKQKATTYASSGLLWACAIQAWAARTWISTCPAQ
jgi:uncharacterized membrane-anchored protein